MISSMGLIDPSKNYSYLIRSWAQKKKKKKEKCSKGTTKNGNMNVQ